MLECSEKNGEGREETPAFVPLSISVECNTSEDAVRDNIAKNIAAGYANLRPHPERPETLHIVGSGPSAADQLLSLHCLGENEHIMALNGAYGWLLENGIHPKYFTMLDARECNTNFVRSVSPSTTHLVASQTHPAVLSALAGSDVRLFHVYTEASRELTKHAPFWIGAGVTVGLVSLGLAAALGYRKVICHGYDSSYSSERSHAFPQAQNEGQDTCNVYLGDTVYRTTGAMAAQTNNFVPLVQRIAREIGRFDVQVTGTGLLPDWVAKHREGIPPREAELAKYRTVYKDSHYHMRPELLAIVQSALRGTPGASYLDVGCGRGETLDAAARLGFASHGTETVPDLIAADQRVEYGVLPSLPFKDNSFDVVGCWEVIEHLIPEDVTPALLELMRVARSAVLLSAAIGSHCVGGMELHPSARPESEWDALLRHLGFTFEKLGVTHINSPVYRIHKVTHGVH